MTNKKIAIVICASASTYGKVIPYCDEISKLGLNIILPDMAEQMKQNNTVNKEATIDWSKDPASYAYKAELIRGHFDKIEKGDAVLVMNFEKRGIPNYIGGNVLMEMTVAFYLHKPIYILNSAPEDSSLLDEILGMQPIFLEGDIAELVNYYSNSKT